MDNNGHWRDFMQDREKLLEDISELALQNDMNYFG